MNTLKMKVLLILISQTLWQRVRQSLLIWIATSFVGSVFLWATEFIGLKLFEIVMLSLAFSGPAVVCLIPALYFISFVSDRGKRIITSLISVLVLCVFIIAIFLHIIRHYPITESGLLYLLLPYVLAAPVCFFSVAHKMILARS
jgi:hypothetical protein